MFHGKGRERHIHIDTAGLLFAARVHTADIQDRDGTPGVFAAIRHAFRLCAMSSPTALTLA